MNFARASIFEFPFGNVRSNIHTRARLCSCLTLAFGRLNLRNWYRHRYNLSRPGDIVFSRGNGFTGVHIAVEHESVGGSVPPPAGKAQHVKTLQVQNVRSPSCTSAVSQAHLQHREL
jgi:hypothetical protein